MLSSRSKSEASRVGRNKASAPPDNNTPEAASSSKAETLDWERMETMLSEMKGEICGKIDSTQTEIRKGLAR